MKILSQAKSLAVRGYAGMLGLLIVVVIIMLLIIYGPMHKNETTNVPQAITYIDHSAEVACQANRQMMETNIVQMQINSPDGIPITTEIYNRKFGMVQCPRGGTYVIQNGKVYCTKHFPPPVNNEQ